MAQGIVQADGTATLYLRIADNVELDSIQLQAFEHGIGLRKTNVVSMTSSKHGGCPDYSGCQPGRLKTRVASTIFDMNTDGVVTPLTH